FSANTPDLGNMPCGKFSSPASKVLKFGLFSVEGENVHRHFFGIFLGEVDVGGHRDFTPNTATSVLDFAGEVSDIFFCEVILLRHLAVCRSNELVGLMVASFAIALINKGLPLLYEVCCARLRLLGLISAGSILSFGCL